MKVTLKVPYDARASENMMNRVWNPRTKKRGHGITREARAWRDNLIAMVEPYKGQFGPTSLVSFQIISNGKARGDTANFVKLGSDAITRGLGLPSDTKFDIRALPRIRQDTLDSYIEIILDDNR